MISFYQPRKGLSMNKRVIQFKQMNGRYCTIVSDAVASLHEKEDRTTVVTLKGGTFYHLDMEYDMVHNLLFNPKKIEDNGR